MSETGKAFDGRAFDAALAQTAQPLPLFRDALKQGRAALKSEYRNLPARELLKRHSALIDALLARAWQVHAARLPTKHRVALVAVGGYGRAELHPASDIDLMLLTDKGDTEVLRGFAEPFFYFLWDMGLEVGHSVRSLKDCAREAKKDITVCTNLMESRLLVGPDTLMAELSAAIAPTRLWPSKKFFIAKRDEQRARHAHFEDTLYNLEPNIKEGPGGLRDIQTIAWVTQRHFGTRTLHDLVTLKFLSEAEYRTLARGQHFLWDLRNGLHYLAGRREDRLLFDHQRALAQLHGFRDRPGRLAVEQLMKRYYRTIKELALLNEILLQHIEEAILTAGKDRIKPLNRRFQARNDFIEATHPRVFERAPWAMLEMFLLLQQHATLKGVRASTIRLIRANLTRIDHTFRKDLAARALFMEILRQPRGITHELRRMNAYGVLGAYIPAFGRVVGQMQHDLFHVYTVDEHTLFVVRNLRRFTVPEFRNEFPLASEIIVNLVKPERLYIAGLFHDIAKGRGGDHSTLGERDAEVFCRHHGLSEYDTRFVAWLVRHHLLMSHTAQREDISDPDVVLQFAQQVGDAERLANLYLLTVADMRGTSPKVWNAWKGRLLAQLYYDTLRLLRRGFGAPIDVAQHIADLQAEARAALSAGTTPEAAAQFWQRLDPDYFLRHDADGIAWHASVIAPAPATDLPLAAARYRAHRGGTEVLIFTQDRDDLFAILTAGLERMNLNIVDARIHTTASGFALDTFVVLDRNNEAIADARALDALAQGMRAQLLDPKPGRSLDASVMSRQLKHFPIETRVSFQEARNGGSTIMEVTAQDRPGLLHRIALALQACGVRLVTAKVATYGERAEDVFFVTDRNGSPLRDAQARERLAQAVHARLDAAAREGARSLLI